MKDNKIVYKCSLCESEFDKDNIVSRYDTCFCDKCYQKVVKVLEEEKKISLNKIKKGIDGIGLNFMEDTHEKNITDILEKCKKIAEIALK